MTPYYWSSKLKKKTHGKNEQDSTCDKEIKRDALADLRTDEAKHFKSPAISFEEECWLADQILEDKQ